MFIKTEDGNLINANLIYEVTASNEKLRDGTYGVIAHILMNGNRILSRHATFKEASEKRDRYFEILNRLK